MWPIIVVWLLAILLGGLLWQRFTRPSVPMVPVPGQSAVPSRRVVPLWLVLALFILLVAALWFTLRWNR